MAEYRFDFQCCVAIQLQLSIFAFLQVALVITAKTPEEIEKIMKEHNIVPDIVEYPPKHELKIKYVYGYKANFGNNIDPNDLEGRPFWVRFPRGVNDYFTLLMIDPDQPSRSEPKESEWVHWLVNNMDGISVYSGDTIVKYLTPKPENGTGPHRFIFFIFKQPGGRMNFTEKAINNTRYDGKIRGHFNTKDFIKRNKFGAPHASNFFYSEYKPPRNGTTTVPPEFRFTYQTIDADILDGDIDYDVHGIPGINSTSHTESTGKDNASTAHSQKK
ncbi:protein D1 [Bemisia tabaci]|uniref:protein D1 n=1 Tax=Bemisia tabaci TaxID=7038 RepID=UPI003B2851E9